jgi:hypothetical protein
MSRHARRAPRRDPVDVVGSAAVVLSLAALVVFLWLFLVTGDPYDPRA